jgi:hypothetical protein
MTKTDKAEYLQWYRDRVRLYVPPPDQSRWFDKVEENHQEIRNFLGGSSLCKTCETDDVDNDVGIHDPEIDKIFNDIQRLIPSYIYYYGFYPEDLRSTYMHDPFGRKIRWGKHITSWMSERKVSPESRKEVNKVIARLGEIYSKASSQKGKLYFYLITDPKAFVRIGHYGIDPTCFANGGLNEVHKFIIGQTRHSFVGLLSADPIDLDTYNSLEVSGNIMARFCGVADSTMRAFHCFNFYPRPPGESIINTVANGFSQVLGVNPIAVKRNCIKTKGVFYNPNSSYTFHDPKFSWNYPLIDMDTTGLEPYRLCFKCKKQARDNVYEQIELAHYCPECAVDAFNCELTGIKTIGNRYYIRHGGKDIRVCRTVYEERSKTCQITRKAYLESEMELTAEGSYLSKEYLQSPARIHKKCPNTKCGRWNLQEKLVCEACEEAFANKETSPLLV